MTKSPRGSSSEPRQPSERSLLAEELSRWPVDVRAGYSLASRSPDLQEWAERAASISGARERRYVAGYLGEDLWLATAMKPNGQGVDGALVIVRMPRHWTGRINMVSRRGVVADMGMKDGFARYFAVDAEPGILDPVTVDGIARAEPGGPRRRLGVFSDGKRIWEVLAATETAGRDAVTLALPRRSLADRDAADAASATGANTAKAIDLLDDWRLVRHAARRQAGAQLVNEEWSGISGGKPFGFISPEDIEAGTLQVYCTANAAADEGELVGVVLDGVSPGWNGYGRVVATGAEVGTRAFMVATLVGSYVFPGEVVSAHSLHLPHLASEFSGEVGDTVEAGESISGVWLLGERLYALWCDARGREAGWEAAESLAEALPGGYLWQPGRARELVHDGVVFREVAQIRERLAKDMGQGLL